MRYTVIAREDVDTGEWITNIPAFRGLVAGRYGSIAAAAYALQHTISVHIQEAASTGAPRPPDPKVEVFTVDVHNPYWVEPRDKREQTAYHEAGHAVAMLLNRHRFRHITITPTTMKALSHDSGTRNILSR